MMKDMYEGKVCTCQADPSINDISSEEEQSNDIRRKRSILGDIAQEEEAVGFVAPMLKVQALFS